MPAHPAIRWPAEWEPQDGVLLAWPHPAATLWRTCLPAAQQTVAALAAAITRTERVVLIAPSPADCRPALQAAGADLARVTIHCLPTNDIWTRDFGPLTVRNGSRPTLLDFTFNGWGSKYPSDRDNAATGILHRQGAFGHTSIRSPDFVLEGGSIESDGAGTLLTTRSCLLNPNRNPARSPAQIEATLQATLGAQRILWLDHGYLAGDDTDGHVDMLVRFAPGNTLIYQQCPDPADEHFTALAALERQLADLRTAAGQPYRLIPLPWPAPHHDAAGQRLPASYANFLIINEAVLVPTYGDPSDAAAVAAVGRAFPGRTAIGLDASTLIRQHGAIHCISMQLPEGVLS